MKIPIRYGLLTALGLIIWVLLARTLIANPQSLVHTLLGPIFFNVLHFVMLFLGIKALERERGERLSFKEAFTTGISIAFVFALTASLFFLCVVLVIGDKWLDVELARNAGARGILVRTGYGAGVEQAAPAGLEPAGVVDTLREAADLIVSGRGRALRPHG